MKGLIMFLPNLVKAGFRLWEKSKEWDAKKRMVVFTVIPASLILFAVVVGMFGEENARIAAEILTQTMTAFADML